MANEIRLRSNNISGAINDNPLLIGATTINSPGFADLPTVTSVNHLILVLDPLEVIGAAEVVMVTAHTAAATSITVVRGQEGSVARQHPLATTWFHGPVVSDWNYTQRAALSTNRPVSPFIGEIIYETDTTMVMSWNGSSWNSVTPRHSSPSVVPGGTTSGTTALLLGTISVPAVSYPTVHNPKTLILLQGTVAADEFEIGIHDGAVFGVGLMRAIRYNVLAGTKDERVIDCMNATVIAAATAKTYTLWAQRLGGTGTATVTADSRYSVFAVDIRSQG